MSDLDRSGVYGFEDGKSGNHADGPPEWWLPKIDRTLLKSLMKRNNYRAFISHGGWFLPGHRPGVSLRPHIRLSLVHPLVLPVRHRAQHVQRPLA